MANACLFSGGKDSVLALHKAMELSVKIDLLLTMFPKNKESYMFHYPNLAFTSMQAEALGIKQEKVETEGVKENELMDLKNALLDNDVKLLVTGAIASKYQADRINAIANDLGIEHLAPLWHMDQIAELKEVSEKFNAIITSVSAEGLDESFLGRRIDKSVVEEISKLAKRYGINASFEGGEAESFVLDAPLFNSRIEIKRARKEVKGNTGIYIIEKAELVSKDDYE